MPPTDVLLVSLGSTAGLRAADAELRAALERAGARVTVAAAAPQRDVRTMALTDLAWARGAHRLRVGGCRAGRARARARRAPPARRPLLDHDRGAALAGARGRALR